MKTAVEWLIQELKENSLLTFDEWKELFEKAKEMEKEQIINAASDHCYPTCELARIEAEQYYNKNFKSE
jgi:predicted methyltransferase